MILNAPVERDHILQLIPHQGAMCLWDRVLAWDENSIHLHAGNHRDLRHPLRYRDRLHAVHLCEYGAQAMAVHGGLRARQAGGSASPGLLVALRGVQLHCERLDGLSGMIECHAQALVQGEGGWQYAFRIEHDSTLLAEGRAAVMPRP